MLTCRHFTAGGSVGDFVEIASADFTLVFDCCVAVALSSEFLLLQIAVRLHASLFVIACQLEHAIVVCMEAGQGDKLQVRM